MKATTANGTLPRSSRITKRQGSVLVPVVATMLLLSLVGATLVELFAVQQSQSVSSTMSTRAFWIAEAGIWHSAHDGASIPTAVPFASGSYVVSKNGDQYTSGGSLWNASRVVSRTTRVGSGGGGSSDFAPLDVNASASGAVTKGKKKIKLPLVSTVPEDVIIDAFSLSANVATEPLHRLRLDKKRIFHDSAGEPLPSGVISIAKLPIKDRTISGLDSPELEIEFDRNPKGTVTYVLTLYFADGRSSVITFVIEW